MVGARRQGFTLVELLVVVAVTGLIASLAIPIVLRSRTAPNGVPAIGAPRAIVSAQDDYRPDGAARLPQP
jgi:prepilin-type N-terminal cleavage/methylation domain-containing protein